MGLTDVGRDLLLAAVLGEAVTFFNNANAHLGVGNGTTAFAKTQTDLVGASKLRKPMAATYPQRSVNTVTFRSVFGDADANFQWNEWGAFNALSGGSMLNRAVPATNLGTKTNGTWTLTTTFQLNN